MANLADELRAFALSLPGAFEDFPWGDRVAKVNGKIFVFLPGDGERGPRRITVKLVESHPHALAIEGAEPTGYGLGRSGWLTIPVEADGVTLDLLCDWIEESYRIIAPKRLVAELDRGKTYSVPFRVVVHQIVGWTIQDYFAGRRTDVPLPDDWEPELDDESDAVVSRYYLEDLIEPLPEKTRLVMQARYLRGLEPAQIAAELQMEPNAVHQRLHDGHNRLRETLADG